MSVEESKKRESDEIRVIRRCLHARPMFLYQHCYDVFVCTQVASLGVDGTTHGGKLSLKTLNYQSHESR